MTDEQVRQLLEAAGFRTAYTMDVVHLDAFARIAEGAQAAEREACAALMEQQHAWITNTAAAALIRARGSQS